MKAKLARALIAKNLELAPTHPGEFIDRLCYTFNPKIKGGSPDLPFRLFPFQWQLVDDLVSAIDEGYDLFIEKCREMGATYVTLYVFVWYWRYRQGSNFLIGSRTENFVDNTGSKMGEDELSNKEESLFGKIDYCLEHLDPQALPAKFNKNKHRTFESLINPELGNVIAGESSNPNFSRGGRQKAILMDEFAFWENDTAAWGSTADTTDCRIILTTPGIRPNTKAKRLRDGRDGEHILVKTLPHTLDPRKDAAWIAKQRDRRSVEDFAREVMINWEASVKGIVYPEIRYAEMGKFPYMPNQLMFQTWDFGLDGVAIQWWQRNPDNGKMRLVDAYTKADQPIQFFFPFCKQEIDSFFDYDDDDLDAMMRVKPFRRPIHYGDPDVAKRSMTSKEKTSNRKELEKIHVYVQTKPASNDFFTRREATKVMLQGGIEVNETPGTLHWMDCIKGARYPQRSEGSQATTAIVLPIHDDTSHHRTATEYLAVNFDPARFEDEDGELPETSLPGGSWQ